MVKTLLIILSAATLVMADNTNAPVNLDELPTPTREEGNIETITANGVFSVGTDSFTSFPQAKRAEIFHPITNVVWHLEGTNKLDLTVSPFVVTQWVTIERFQATNKFFLRQMGQVQTNRTLQLNYGDRKETILLEQVGKGEWLTEKRVVPEPAKPAVKK